MIRPIFSTVACPHWTLDGVARAAAAMGYDGVELRTFGYGSREFACDPALTSPAKTRSVFGAAGVAVCTLATSARFDDPIRPRVIGRVVGDHERGVRQLKAAIDLAAQVECPFVRCFAFELGRRERRAAGVARIVERLKLGVDGARNTGVRVVLENGGSFPTGADIAELIDRVADPLLGAEYSAAAAFGAGEDPVRGAAVLGERLLVAKIKDLDARGRPCALGEGIVPVARFVEELAGARGTGWLVYEWDRAWLPDLAPPEAVLPEALRRMYAFMGRAAPEPAGAGA